MANKETPSNEKINKVISGPHGSESPSRVREVDATKYIKDAQPVYPDRKTKR